MKLLQTLRQWRWKYFSVILIAAAFGSFGVWRSLAVQKQPIGAQSTKASEEVYYT